MNQPRPILVMITYDIGIGFAIGRLVAAFYEMALRFADSPRDVHFSFAKIDGKSSSLPADFSNLMAFDYTARADEQRFGEYLSTHRIHTIFALDMRVNAPCLSVARRAGIRRIVSYWGAPMSSIVWWKWPLKRLQVALTRSKPDLFIFESQVMRRLAIWGRGVAASSTAVVRTGVDTQRFRPGPSRVYEQFGIPRHRKIIVYMGHCVERKGIHVLMDAARELIHRNDIHVLVLGNRPGEAENLARPSNVTFAGYQVDVPGLLSGCYAGCIPSTGWDSYPMSSLEMQACGLPVIVSDCQGCPETIDKNTGVVVPAGNQRALAEAIASLVDNPIRRDRMSAAARSRIERELTTEHQITNLVKAIRGIS